jgi:hypothetical protein
MMRRMGRVQPGILVAVGLAVLLASCSVAATHAVRVGAGTSPRQRAAADAAALLARVTLPPGSRRSDGVPPGGLALTRRAPSARSVPPPASDSGGAFMQLAMPPVGSVDVVRGEWWIAPGSVDRVSSWLTSHPPVAAVAIDETASAEACARSTGRCRRSRTTSSTLDFQAAAAGHFAVREILVGLAPGARGTTVVRVEAQSAWTSDVSATARVSARIAHVRTCLTQHGLVIAAGGPSQATDPHEPLGELVIRVTGSSIPGFLAFYPNTRAAQNTRPALTSNARRFNGFVEIVGSETVVWPHRPVPSTQSALDACLVAP